ncbi:hydrogenase small subunit [Sulfurovum sp. zt1-1]|uniref:Hydrogenase small subunit n=1 Tax=Sulfurovum zhangzhouensis TaxID=3019067 RepID=A0ABT7QV44_9BACT|nr:hydrogenase small subunit [Sulfurovum zhangzhouensis]MDM5270701.1 hydrogenase small subunit [Sulfurovum zhangzhouensis]
MQIVIIGGGISAAYIANRIKEIAMDSEVHIISDESVAPYDRIHLCRLVDDEESPKSIALDLHPSVKVTLNQKIINIDTDEKKVLTADHSYSYDKLIIATGSIPRTLFDIEGLDNASVFRSAHDSQKIRGGIKGHEVVIVGSGPLALELLETLNMMEDTEHITLLVRSNKLYAHSLSSEAQNEIESAYLKSGKVRISYENEIIDTTIIDGHITQLKTKKFDIDEPYLIFGVGIQPNIDFAKESLAYNRGILTNEFMQTSNEDIYAVGEAAEVESLGFIAGHVKECTMQADVALSHLFGSEEKRFHPEVSVDMLKVGEFDLIDVSSPERFKEKDFEKILMTSPNDHRVDEYYIKDDKLIRFIGINSNVDVGYLEDLVRDKNPIDASYLYENRVLSERGRLICSCEHVYTKDLEDIVQMSGVSNFQELGEFTQAGRVCGRCKKMVEDVVAASQHLIDPNMPKRSAAEIKQEKELALARKRIEKFNKLHPHNQLSTDNLSSAMDAYEITDKEMNQWVSMATANMQLHPEFEALVNEGVRTLNKVPVIWLELADCSGNSEAFIKTSHPGIADLIFDYISLDYHELLMSSAGDQSETVLEHIITHQKGEFVLIVEGAIPLAMDGKFLRIGPQGQTGIELLKKCANDAALIISVGACAFDGGVVAAAPNPTGAVGVSEALGRQDVINLPGCPVNPMNIVGTLLYYLMFEELPKLDSFNRPLWAYEGRIHDNCERRGHYELGEFVKEWGDEGAKKGWCLFEMGCKGPYANANCPTMKFNLGTSWPVQGGHGCMGCVETKFFDRLATERKVEE